MAVPGFLKITHYQCSGCRGSFGAGESCAKCVPVCLHGIPMCQLVIRSGSRSFKSWLRLQLRHRQEDREVADKIWALVFQAVPLFLLVLLES